MEEAGGEEERHEGDVWYEIGSVGREQIGLKNGK